MSTHPINPECVLGPKPAGFVESKLTATAYVDRSVEFPDLASARAYLDDGRRDTHYLCAGLEQPYRVLPNPRELPSPFMVQLDAILTQGEMYLLLRRAGLRLVDQGENKPYLLTVEPQSALSRVGQLEAATAAVNAERRRIARDHAAWRSPAIGWDAESVARRRRGEYTTEETDALIRESLESGHE